jgi:predicted  nucleic acid-binding Zn-ribbon protein
MYPNSSNSSNSNYHAHSQSHSHSQSQSMLHVLGGVGAGMSGTGIVSPSSSYSPNYPVHDPVFVIPQVPELTKVPEFNKHTSSSSSASNRLTPGYDMRTLRKQLEGLVAEIEERTHTQHLLYRQNEELWAYTQTLMEANKVNVQTMQQQMHQLHSELRELHAERTDLAHKLQHTNNANELLRQLDADIQHLQVENTNAESLRKQAEVELQRANLERVKLATQLERTHEELEGRHTQLDTHRALRQEEESLQRAEEFFYTSKSVLKAAYSRFRASVCRDMRLSRIRTVFVKVYAQHLKREHLNLWKMYVYRRRIMHANTRTRELECRDECFDNWKVFTMLEKLRKSVSRKHMLAKIFGAWKRFHKEETWERSSTFKVCPLHCPCSSRGSCCHQPVICVCHCYVVCRSSISRV